MREFICTRRRKNSRDDDDDDEQIVERINVMDSQRGYVIPSSPNWYSSYHLDHAKVQTITRDRKRNVRTRDVMKFESASDDLQGLRETACVCYASKKDVVLLDLSDSVVLGVVCTGTRVSVCVCEYIHIYIYSIVCFMRVFLVRAFVFDCV